MQCEQLERDRALANEGLAASVAQSEDIATETAHIRAIHKKINTTLAERDAEWEKRQWFTQNVEALRAWAESGGKLPSVKALDASEYELRILKVALDQIGTKLLALSEREHASLSEELEYRSHLKHLDSIEAHFNAKEAIESIGQVLGSGVVVNVEHGAAELLQRESDELLKRASAERKRAKELEASRPKTKGGQNGR